MYILTNPANHGMAVIGLLLLFAIIITWEACMAPGAGTSKHLEYMPFW